MRRRGSAAAAENYSPGRIYRFHFPPKGGRVHVINRFSKAVQRRKAGIGLGNDGNAGDRRHPADDIRHRVRAGGAVGTYRIRTETFQNDGRCLRIRSIEGSAILFKGHRYHDGEIRAGFLCRDQCGPAFLQTHHGFHDQQIHASLHQIADLFPVYCHQLFEIHPSDGRKLLSRHGQIPGNQRVFSGGTPGGFHQGQVQFTDFSFQTIFGQFDPVGGKSGRVQDVRSCVDVFLLQACQHIRMFCNPLLRADAAGHPAGHQVRAGRSVQQDDPFLYHKIFEVLFVH